MQSWKLKYLYILYQICFSFISNIVSTKPKHKNEIRKIDFDAFCLQKIKKERADFLNFDNFYSLTLPDNIVIYLSLVIIYGNLLKYITVIIHLLKWQLCIMSLKEIVLRTFESCSSHIFDIETGRHLGISRLGRLVTTVYKMIIIQLCLLFQWSSVRKYNQNH